MECTQRLECTQELYGTQNQNERLFPEQIGFLGICGNKHPIKKGPNKIGRDPQTCSIVLKTQSVSRQHAVINVLDSRNFMLMDLDSANKTKLSGQTLKPYIPHPLRNGDTVQFGDIFGIFRQLEEETDLPMTQAIDIPDTPVSIKHVSRLNTITTIPESPDVSDRDDSFIVPSQPNGAQFQSSKTYNYIKPGKTISIQPVGNNKIDNVYWNSSKKSTSLNLDESINSLNNSVPPVKLNDGNAVNSIHELETQEVLAPPKLGNMSTESIYTAETQLPNLDYAETSIYTANTQMPVSSTNSSKHIEGMKGPCEMNPSIHDLNTQMPAEVRIPSIHTLEAPLSTGDNLPEVYKLNEQQDMQIDPCANKENDSIYNAETQVCPVRKDNILAVSNNLNDSLSIINSNSKLNLSKDEVLFDEVFEFQPILSEDIDLPVNRLLEPEAESESQMQIVKPKCTNKNMTIKSDSPLDYGGINMLPTQKITEKKSNDDEDSTDCEEEVINLLMDNQASISKLVQSYDEMDTQVIIHDEVPSTHAKDVKLEDMPTQIIDIDDIKKDAIIEGGESHTVVEFANLPTQVLGEGLSITQMQIVKPKCANKNIRIRSDSPSDYDDMTMLPTKNITEKKSNEDENSTDCEEEVINLLMDNQVRISKLVQNYDEMATQVIIHDETPSTADNNVKFEDMPTQIIATDDIKKDAIIEGGKSTTVEFEDLPTQVLGEGLSIIKQKDTGHSFQHDDSNFKIPYQSPLKGKKKDLSGTPKIKLISNTSDINLKDEEGTKYYQNTQDIYEDLCTQKVNFLEEVPGKTVDELNSEFSRFGKCNKLILEKSYSYNEPDGKVNEFVSNLSSQDAIGVKTLEAMGKKTSEGSTGSDVENTPKQSRRYIFAEIDLPNSQEIKTTVSQSTRMDVTESSSESDTEVYSEEQCTPILFRKKSKRKPVPKLDLTKKFLIEALPSRVITRVRKPTAKMKEQEIKNVSEKILKSNFILEQEGEINNAIITENITRLKNTSKNTKMAKINNSNEESKNPTLVIETKQSTSNKSDTIVNFVKGCRLIGLNEKINKAGSNKDKQAGKYSEVKHTSSKKKDTQAESSKEVRQSDSNKGINQAALNKEVNEAYSSNETKQIQSTRKELRHGGKDKDTYPTKSNKDINKAFLSAETKKGQSFKNPSENNLNKHTQKAIHKCINKELQVDLGKQTQPVCLSKETMQIGIIKESLINKKPTLRSSQKKLKRGDKEKISTETGYSNKADKKRIREPKNIRTEPEKSKSIATVVCTKQLLDASVESRDKTKNPNKSERINTLDLTKSSDETKRNTRSARKNHKPAETSVSPGRESQNSQTGSSNKRKYTRKQEHKEKKKEERNPSPQKEVRRSKRQRNVKETKDEPAKVTRSILKMTTKVPYEESVVYNVSSGSNSDTSHSLKRPALDNSDLPSAKKTKSVVINKNSSRSTPVIPIKTQYILFTAFPYEEVKVKVEKMGAVVVTDLKKSTVVLTRQIKRTFKLLCAVGLGKPIVGPDWVEACANNNTIVDPWLYLMKDEAAEKRFHFSLEQTLTGKRNFLKGYNVSSTPSVMPGPHEMKLIVECSGGTWKEGGALWVCVTTSDDRHLWADLSSKGAILVSTEFILSGVLRQRVDINANMYKI